MFSSEAHGPLWKPTISAVKFTARCGTPRLSREAYGPAVEAHDFSSEVYGPLWNPTVQQ
jgi:hypothetical protein